MAGTPELEEKERPVSLTLVMFGCLWVWSCSTLFYFVSFSSSVCLSRILLVFVMSFTIFRDFLNSALRTTPAFL